MDEKEAARLRLRGVAYAEMVSTPGWSEYMRPEIETLERALIMSLTDEKMSWERTQKVRAQIQIMRRILRMPDAAIQKGREADATSRNESG